MVLSSELRLNSMSVQYGLRCVVFIPTTSASVTLGLIPPWVWFWMWTRPKNPERWILRRRQVWHTTYRLLRSFGIYSWRILWRRSDVSIIAEYAKSKKKDPCGEVAMTKPLGTKQSGFTPALSNQALRLHSEQSNQALRLHWAIRLYACTVNCAYTPHSYTSIEHG